MEEKRDFAGMFFLAFSESREPQFQGQVMSQVGPDSYLCDYFSWALGEWSYSKIHNVEQLGKFIFFQNVDHLEEYMNGRTR